MSRTTPLLRAALATAAGLGIATLLSGCFGPVTPVVTETPKPEVTDFSGIGGDDPLPINTSDPVEPTDPVESGYTTVIDSSGVVAVQVPSSWTDTALDGFTSSTGEQWAAITASPNIESYVSTWSTSGVELGATPVAGDVTDETVISFLEGTVAPAYYDGCQVISENQVYSDQVYVGYVSQFGDCGGVGTSGFALMVVNLDFTHVMYVRGQVAAGEDVDAIYEAITATFESTI